MDAERLEPTWIARTIRDHRVPLALLAAYLCVPVCGFYRVWSNHKRVTITVVACKEATYDPDAKVVHGYPGPPERLPAALGEVWFTTDVTLESLTACTHHHYVRLVVPGDKSSEGEIWFGSIYRVSAEEQAALGASSPIYKAYFPLEVERLQERARGPEGGDGWRVLAEARQLGIALRVGGGQLWWAGSLSSNEALLPISFSDGDKLLLHGK